MDAPRPKRGTGINDVSSQDAAQSLSITRHEPSNKLYDVALPHRGILTLFSIMHRYSRVAEMSGLPRVPNQVRRTACTKENSITEHALLKRIGENRLVGEPFSEVLAVSAVDLVELSGCLYA